MRRAYWSVPSAVIAWLVVGFLPWYVARGPGDWPTPVPSHPAHIDLLVIGGLVGGVAAGLVAGRFRVALPAVSVAVTTAWWAHAGSAGSEGLLIAALVASGLGVTAGALGSHGSLLAALALTLPVATYAARSAAELTAWRWHWQLSGLLVAIGLALLLYVSCWRTGWRAVVTWPVVTAVYLVCFGVLAAAGQVAAGLAGARPPDEVADLGTEAFFSSFQPFLASYWPWLIAGALLAVPMAALKIRALPPVPPAPAADDGRGNDARLSDDLDWIDRPDEVRTRRLPRRQQVA